MKISKQITGIMINPLLMLKATAIRRRIYKVIAPLSATFSTTSEPVPYSDRLNYEYKPINCKEPWGGLFECAWFNFKGEVPPEYNNSDVQLIINIDGEGCIYDIDGEPVKGLSKRLCFADEFSTTRAKHLYKLPPNTTSIDLWVETGNNGWNGKSTGNAYLKRADIVICDQAMYKLYYDFMTLYLLLTALKKGSERYNEILTALKKASKILRKYNNAEIEEAESILITELSKTSDSDFTFYATGHAHLDLAWLWPVRETKRKAVRTFSNQLKLMEEHDDYIFGASQPQQFQWMKDMYPGLFERMKNAVERGNLEPQGGMWVESDTNVVGSESLVRQMLYGKRFFKEEFGKDMRILWLPDVFGFSGALPQIIKKSEMDYFYTIKLSWNEHNKFPYQSFIWEGIDNSKVLVHMPPEGTYNSEAISNSILDAYDRYVEKHTKCAALPYGVGDGGGGPGEAHYEFISREKDLKGLPKVKLTQAIDFFKELEKHNNNLPSYKGELYLEKHQGTLTTQAKNKLYNRKIEMQLRNIELLSTYAMTKGYNYPKDKIESIWKEVLLYQFHDIIPGSSIHRVYKESVERYIAMIEELDVVYNDIIAFLGSEDGLSAINTLQFKREEWIKKDGDWYLCKVKPFSSALLQDVEIKNNQLQYTDNAIENSKLKVVFNSDGSIKEFYDKQLNKQFSGKYLNKLAVYYDKKLHYNAWDIDIKYTKRRRGYFNLIASETYIDGPNLVRKNTYKYNLSELIQEIVLSLDSNMLVFNTTVDWKETHKMLRAEFEPSVFSDKVVCNIQWGNIERTTRTDNPVAYAQYEICAHKFVDVSDNQYGFALLNDCKYGHRVKDGLISLNLLRSTVHPDETADKGEQKFTYAIHTHTGNAYDSDVMELGYKLNNPLLISDKKISLDSIFNIDNFNIIIETVKKCEYSDDIIIRLYESRGRKASASLNTLIDFVDAYECNMLENGDRKINIKKLTFTPYEIKTIKLVRNIK